MPAFATSLIIQPTYGSTITSDPNAATIETTIQSAIDVYQHAFSDNITVKLQFDEMSSGLGSSTTFFGTTSYSTYKSMLTADAKTADDFTNIAHLPASSPDTVSITTANARAIGINLNPPAGAADSIIQFNTALLNLSRSSTDPTKYDLFTVVSHEINEALGFGSILNGLINGASVPANKAYGLDFDRYSAPGVRSLTTGTSAISYFSIDGGATSLAQFNQNDQGDFSDFFSTGAHVVHVQDAFATPGTTPNLGVELRELDVLGYDLVTTPEPSTGALFGIAIAALVIRRRYR